MALLTRSLRCTAASRRGVNRAMCSRARNGGELVRVQRPLAADARGRAIGRRGKTVLVVDYFFPPLAGAAVQRTLGFVRYLVRYGWEPIVLTVRSSDWNFYDASLLDRVPRCVKVERTASVEPLRFARRLFSGGTSPESNGQAKEMPRRPSALK